VNKVEEKYAHAMRSVVSLGPISASEILTTENTTTKRPQLAHSIPASKYYEVMGKKVKKDVRGDVILMWDDVE